MGLPPPIDVDFAFSRYFLHKKIGKERLFLNKNCIFISLFALFLKFCLPLSPTNVIKPFIIYAKMNARVIKTMLIALFAVMSNGISIYADATEDLKKWLETPVTGRGDLADQAFAKKSLTAAEVTNAIQLLEKARLQKEETRYSEIWKTQTIHRDTLTMKFKYRVYGEMPTDGRSLYISMHGGGGTTAEANDQQWENQISLYRPDEGVYVAPRSLHNVWNMWLLPYLDGFFDDLIQSAVAVMGVNPDKVYITGYSAGGDGTFRMAPRMADRWAAALMCAGHPGNTSPVGLRNLPFGMWVGLYDTAYLRHVHGVEWCAALKALQQADPDGYVHNAQMLPTGHWMNRQDTVAFRWMSQFKRNCYPDKVVWKQDSLYLNTSMYWLSLPKEKVTPEGLIVVSRTGNDITIERCYADELTIGLNDEMIDYKKPVTVRYRGKVVFQGKVKRSIAPLYTSFIQRGDTRYSFPTILRVELNNNTKE